MSEKKVFNFMAYRHVATGFSAILLLIAIAALAFRGLNFGLDFTGGTLVEVAFEQPADLSVVREDLAEAGFGNAVVQHFGAETNVLLKWHGHYVDGLGAPSTFW